MKISPKGKKYLTITECEELTQRIELILKTYGLNEKVQYHPRYLEVPTWETND